MTLSSRLLAPGDEPVLEVLAKEDADFDVAGRGEPLASASPDAVSAYLKDPSALHWVVEDTGRVLGLGVRARDRRRGVGRTLVNALIDWMKARQLVELWVVADNPDAVAFYRACGFEAGAPSAAVYMFQSLTE